MVDFKDYTRKMERTLEVLQDEFGAVRAGRANARVLDRISVECGTEMRRVTLCNALGQQLLRVNPNAPQAELQVAGLPHGLYLLHVQTASGSAVRKVVVE